MAQRIAPTGWVEIYSATDRDASVRRVGTGHGRGALASGHGGIWAANRGSGTVARLDPNSLELKAILKLGKAPVGIAAGAGAIWTLALNGWLWRVWPTGPRAEGVSRLGRRARAVATAGEWIWVLRESGQLARLESATGETISETEVPGGARLMIGVEDAVWIATGRGHRIVRVDAESAQVDAEVRLPRRVVSLAADERSVFAGCSRRLSPRHGWLHKIDRRDATAGDPLSLPGRPQALASGTGVLWVACSTGRRRGTIERLDRAGSAPETWRETDWDVSNLLLAGDSLLAAMSLASGNPDAGGFVDGMHGAALGGGEGGGGDGGGGGGGS